MAQVIKFPFRVKLGGKYYAPNEPIKVNDASGYVAQGAIVIGETEADDEAKTSRGRKPKADMKK